MEHNNTPDKKESILKSLAIAGFIGILLLLAWLSIQLVQIFPNALTSLASLAEGVNEYQETTLDTTPEIIPLTVTANTALINTNDTLTVNWSEIRATGSYVFSYECAEGVALTHLSEVGDRAIDCETNYNVGDTNSLTLTFASEKNRYADVTYSVAFLRTDDTAPRAQGGSVVTVFNSDINSQFAFAEESTTVVETETPVTPEETESTSELKPNTPTEPTAPTPQPTEPFVQEFVFTVPVSDPNGVIDLSASFVGVGDIISNSFVAGPVSTDNAGAIQFEVKNIGTKTSGTWTYSIALPTGNTFASQPQRALKPNERALLTIGFPAGSPNAHTFSVSVDTAADRTSANDSFNRTILFAR